MQLLGRRDGRARRTDLLTQGEPLPSLGPQRYDRHQKRQQKHGDDRRGSAARSEIPERQPDRAAVAQQRQRRTDRDAGQQDQLGHQKQQPEEDQQYDIKEFHRIRIGYKGKEFFPIIPRLPPLLFPARRPPAATLRPAARPRRGLRTSRRRTTAVRRARARVPRPSRR